MLSSFGGIYSKKVFRIKAGEAMCTSPKFFTRIWKIKYILLQKILSILFIFRYLRDHFDQICCSLLQILEGTEVTARRTAAASVAATKILYNQRHSRSEDFTKDSLVLGIFGAGVQGKSHAIAFHAAHPNISQVIKYIPL